MPLSALHAPLFGYSDSFKTESSTVDVFDEAGKHLDGLRIL